MKRREPTDEERALWDEQTKADKKLRKSLSLEGGGKGGGQKVGGGQKINSVQNTPKRDPHPNLPPSRGKEKRNLSLGDVTQMDGRNADRFRKGKTPTDATLDLHGMNRTAAFAAFRDFVIRCHESGKRRLLIITGKGRGDEPGVLRQSLPDWANDGAVRSLILAYDKAQPRHGGDGAFYVMLKKRR